MGFRTVIIKSRAKLECRLNYLIIRGENETKLYLDEINTIIIQSTAVALTASLVSVLSQKNVKIIFCDEKCNPVSEIVPYYGAHNTTKRYKEQILWDNGVKKEAWRIIIEKKIMMQSRLLFDLGYFEQSEMLNYYASNVLPGDTTNREGHSAKVYFNCILGMENSRKGGGFLNGCLNYGYAVINSALNREIVAKGYLTQLGIWHDNEFNQFNLSCDLMEPLRPVVDRLSLQIKKDDKDFKKKLVNILNFKCKSGEKNTTLDIAMKQYVASFFKGMAENDCRLFLFPEEIEIEI